MSKFPVKLIRHPSNLGYGASIIDAFDYAAREGYDWVITMDCDERRDRPHSPLRPRAGTSRAFGQGPDVVSGSRYIASMDEATTPPADRRAINVTLTEEVNHGFSASNRRSPTRSAVSRATASPPSPPST